MWHQKNKKDRLPPRPEWQKATKRRRRRYILFIFIFFISLLIGFLVWQNKYLAIKEIKVTRSQSNPESDYLISEEAVKDRIQEQLGEKFLLFFHQNTYLSVQSQRIKTELLKDLRLRSLRIKQEWPNQLIVSFTERQPAVKFSILGDKDYYLDSDGRLIGPAINILRHLDLPTIYDKTELDWRDPELSETIKIALNLLQGNTELNGFIKLTAIEINQTVGVLQIVASTDEGWKAYFVPQEGIRGQISNIRLILLEGRLAKEQRGG